MTGVTLDAGMQFVDDDILTLNGLHEVAVFVEQHACHIDGSVVSA